MTRKEAIHAITGNDDESTPKNVIEKKYKNALNLLKAQIRDAPSDEDKKNYEQKIEELKDAFPIALGLPGITPIKKSDNTTTINQPWAEQGDTVSDEVSLSKTKKPSFLESLMNPKVFFLVLSSLVSAILFMILWLGAKGDGKLMEGMEKVLTNRPFVIENTGDKDYRLIGFKVFFFDKSTGKMNEYSNYNLDADDKYLLKPGRKSKKIEVDSLRGKIPVYTGEVLFFQILYQSLDGSETKVLADYAGSYQVDDNILHIDLDNIEKK